jgi:guanylate kinase
MRGPLIILSGPSGSGKSTVVRRLLDDPPCPLWVSVSATTRPPRPGELDGVDYHFWTRERFEQERDAGAFLEYAVVHGTDYYGTLRSEVESRRTEGTAVILVIDVQGAEQVRRACPDHVSVFLYTPMDELERRLLRRGTEDPAIIRRRLETAKAELAQKRHYQYEIVNDDLARATAELRGVVAREFERSRNAR